ncbi:DNA/RNA non-specific endonuclease [Bradyrhizobium sp. S3.5.5]|uniref:DNA/RNA non-specific endonuclease n=1 Tax=Bradyrhizobium sp. S3.5.5 TaxID=3156430 RepID=UPI00339B2C2C
MATNEEQLASLRAFNASIQGSDSDLDTERADRSPVIREAGGSPAVVERQIQRESIILRRERPVLAIQGNRPRLSDMRDKAESEVWEPILAGANDLIERTSRAVGRIDLEGGRLDWVGTGWLVGENLIVTNRHVAEEFTRRKGDGFVFRTGMNGPIAAGVDFLQEIDNESTLLFSLVKPLHVESEPGPDLALFEVELTSGDDKLSTPIELATTPIVAKHVATIGYPAYDSRIPELDLMKRVFDGIYDKKRLAPGAVTSVQDVNLLHNCTTLGGNSGSVVLDLDSGQALGLHFSGSFLKTNYAVRSDIVRKIVSDVRSGRKRPVPSPPQRVSAVSDGAVSNIVRTGSSVSLTIPLKVTVSVDVGDTATTPKPVRPAPPAVDHVDIAGEEGVVADYDDRKGYDANFLGRKFAVALPDVRGPAGDVLEFPGKKGPETVLRYEHFSVVMSRSRRICFFSAVNIDGKQSKKNRRAGWKWDPRIPKSQQIMNQCYGNPPRFSRGHMTRREDPGWGPANTARRGNEDSMHVTNTTPQMQKFNSPIWLGLEDYALDHAREDKMKISVFTGPYLRDDDPKKFETKIPRAFWKVIAFIHDDTDELCATGYEMNQEKTFVSDKEHVFADYFSPQLATSTQVSIASIERRSGISFGSLTRLDPLVGTEEAFGAEGIELDTFEQIRFVR